MRWSVAPVVLLIGLTLLSNFAYAQPAAEDGLILSSGCGRFHLVLGRITLDSFRYKKVRLHVDHGEESEDEEFVCVTANKGTPSLHYLRQIGPSRVTIDTMDTNAIRIESKTMHASGVLETLLIQQPSEGMIQVVSSLGTQQRNLKSASVWHLMVEEPVLFEQQVLPVLGLMISRCRLDRFTEAIDRKLRLRASEVPTLTGAYVQQLVNKLASPRRTQRLRAQRELVKCGVGILPLLDKVDPNFLDAEQRQRIGELKQHLTNHRSDTPDRVAAWLSTDRDYWHHVCRRWEASDRQSAHRYLIATCGEGLKYGSNLTIASQPDSTRQ